MRQRVRIYKSRTGQYRTAIERGDEEIEWQEVLFDLSPCHRSASLRRLLLLRRSAKSRSPLTPSVLGRLTMGDRRFLRRDTHARAASSNTQLIVSSSVTLTRLVADVVDDDDHDRPGARYALRLSTNEASGMPTAACFSATCPLRIKPPMFLASNNNNNRKRDKRQWRPQCLTSWRRRHQHHRHPLPLFSI